MDKKEEDPTHTADWASLSDLVPLPFVDLSVGESSVSGRDMPDVHLDALCSSILTALTSEKP